MNIAILPARGGSKRIPNKNIIPFAGKPMIGHALDAARASNLFDVIHVSTDSDDIMAVAHDLGFPQDFKRPAHLADDVTGIAPVLAHVLDEYQTRGQIFDSVCLIYPCAMLLDAADLVRGYEIFNRLGGARDVMSVAEYPVPVEWAYAMGDDGILTPRSPGAFNTRSQDLEKAYYDTGTFAIFSSDRVRAGLPDMDKNLAAAVLPKYKAVDIDEPEDLMLAEILYRGKKAVEDGTA